MGRADASWASALRSRLVHHAATGTAVNVLFSPARSCLSSPEPSNGRVLAAWSRTFHKPRDVSRRAGTAVGVFRGPATGHRPPFSRFHRPFFPISQRANISHLPHPLSCNNSYPPDRNILSADPNTRFAPRPVDSCS